MLGRVYSLAKYCFWLLPAPLRSVLNDTRYFVVRWFRSRYINTLPKAGDINWQTFQEVYLDQKTYRGVIIFEPSIDWGALLFQRPHHMAMALGRSGCLVIFKTTGDGVNGVRKVAANVWVANDPMVDAIQDAIRVFYSTSLLADENNIRAARERGQVVYEYIDHIDAAISGGKSAMKRLQRLKRAAFDGGADVIISSAKVLHEEAISQCGFERCALIPNGVDVKHYQDQRCQTKHIPNPLLSLSRNCRFIVGYFGAIAPWLWYEAIDEIALRMPDVAFVFIGPDYSGCVPLLPKHNNVFYFGAVEYEILPQYASQFDVCFIPFKTGAIAQSTSPLKLFEYFALEKPVVVTAEMKECVAFSEVFAASSAADFVEKIYKAFEMREDETYLTSLNELAMANDWNRRAELYLNVLGK